LLDGVTTTGVSIIKLDSHMDHGPLLVQNAYEVDPQETSGTLEVQCGQLGGELLSQTLEAYVAGSLTPKEQDHSKATLCKKIDKSMGEITLDDDAITVCRKFRALTPWPSLYFFHTHNNKTIRIKITDIDRVSLYTEEDTARDIILSVIPEGKKEMGWESFKRGYAG
jgi:methionyl-tRNA formyltransferase